MANLCSSPELTLSPPSLPAHWPPRILSSVSCPQIIHWALFVFNLPVLQPVNSIEARSWENRAHPSEGSPCVTFASLGNQCPVWPVMPWPKALWFFFGGGGAGAYGYSGGRANWLLGNSSSILVRVHPGFNCYHWFFCFSDAIKLLYTAKSWCAYMTVSYFAPPTSYSIF